MDSCIQGITPRKFNFLTPIVIMGEQLSCKREIGNDNAVVLASLI